MTFGAWFSLLASMGVKGGERGKAARPEMLNQQEQGGNWPQMPATRGIAKTIFTAIILVLACLPLGSLVALELEGRTGSWCLCLHKYSSSLMARTPHQCHRTLVPPREPLERAETLLLLESALRLI